MTKTDNTQDGILECDYLVVGAGAASLAFVDTLLTELPETKILLIDKRRTPGGHWVDAYGFVRLHQPSRFYGIASRKLEGTADPSEHRATKGEILSYFGSFLEEKIASEQVLFYPGCVYEFQKGEKDDGSFANDGAEDNLHYFRSVDGSESFRVRVRVKLIDGTKGECIIPHDSPLQFPVDEEVRVMTPNQIFDAFQEENGENSSLFRDNKYVVLGAGKTGIDTVVYLQRTMRVDPSNIAWIISQDVWMGYTECRGDPQTWARYLAEYENDINQAALALEAEGMLVRLDPNVLPSRFRFPNISPDELQLARQVETLVRRGRATCIRRKSRTSSEVVVEFGGRHPPWEAFAPIDSCVFIHATSPGPFNGMPSDIPIFNNSKMMTLQLLLTGPRTFSMSLLAKFEAGRRKNTLDLDCLRRLAKVETEDLENENEILKASVRPLARTSPYRPILNLAITLAILDKDPLAAIDWMNHNRLCDSGSKAVFCQDLRMLLSRGRSLGLPENDMRMLQVLGDKLRPLEGP